MRQNLAKLAQMMLLVVRFLEIHLFVLAFPVLRRFSRKKWLFNLDCHISVIADLRRGLQDYPGVNMVSWNLSGHNFVFRRLMGFSDPVMGVNRNTWMKLSQESLNRFDKTYRRFLRQFDGFIVTYPPAFIEIFRDYRKPILLVVATRYEFPFTASPGRWRALTQTLKSLRSEGLLTIVANNLGDSDYLASFGIEDVPVVPSLCDYVPHPNSIAPRKCLVFAKSLELETFVEDAIGPPWVSRTKALGTRYEWGDVSSCHAIVYIPYNASTMTLFELASLGVPVLVPSPAFLKKLAGERPGVMSELTFLELRGVRLESDSGSRDSIKWGTSAHLDWWMERADFYDAHLMPNVFQFESFEDEVFSQDFERHRKSLEEITGRRNHALRMKRSQLLDNFVAGL